MSAVLFRYEVFIEFAQGQNLKSLGDISITVQVSMDACVCASVHTGVVFLLCVFVVLCVLCMPILCLFHLPD